MSVEEAARILRGMYEAGATKRKGMRITGIHLFGIKYADDLTQFNTIDVVVMAGLAESYRTEVTKGMRLAGPWRVWPPYIGISELLSGRGMTPQRTNNREIWKRP